MSTRIINNTLIFLIIIYTLLIFTNIALADLLTDQELASLQFLLIIEISILCFFQLEVILQAFGQGFSNYFKDLWLVFDGLVITASMALVILDLTINMTAQFSSISSIIRGIFRFLRIFLLMRKMQTIKKIKTSSKIKTPAEKIIDLLCEIRELFETQDIIEDIDWSIDIIGSNRLYDRVLGQDAADQANDWKEFGIVQSADLRQDDEGQEDKQQKIETNKTNIRNYKVLSIIPEKIMTMFENLQELTFDCWELKKLTKGQELKYLMLYLFEQNNLITDLNINPTQFSNFITVIQENYYEDNPYHNCLHAFDVTQTTNFFLKKLKFEEIAKLNSIEIAACYISAACHDVQHPGFTNIYIINVKHSLSIEYNDQSCLENHHVSFSFSILLSKEEYNFTSKWSNEDFKKFREIMINIILSTDMTRHFSDIAKLKARLAQPEFNIHEKNDKLMCMDSIVHASDISNPIKAWKTCFKWTEVVMAEFWRQGDNEREAKLPISFLCDRYKTNMAGSQEGFINFVVKPIYELIGNFLPNLIPYMQNFADNGQRWTKLIPEYEEKLKILEQEKLKKLK